MELEEAINRLENLKLVYEQQSELIPEYEDKYLLDKQAIETVLKELEKLDKKFRFAVPDDVIAEEYISKKKIKDKIEELKQIKTENGDTYIDVVLVIKVLHELLEEKWEN